MGIMLSLGESKHIVYTVSIVLPFKVYGYVKYNRIFN